MTIITLSAKCSCSYCEPLSSSPSAASKGLIKPSCLAYYLVIPFCHAVGHHTGLFTSYRLFTAYLCYRVCVCVCISGRISFIVLFICTMFRKQIHIWGPRSCKPIPDCEGVIIYPCLLLWRRPYGSQEQSGARGRRRPLRGPCGAWGI